jgi:purine-nucleoside phosphorylase
MLEKIKKSISYISSRTDLSPLIGIILGSGLANFAGCVNTKQTVDYKDIPGFPPTTAEGHKGRMIFGSLENKIVVIMQGRHHFYEEQDMNKVIYPVRVLKYLGIKYLIITNAAGSLNPDFEIGDLMIVSDHINMMLNPLAGIYYPEFGDRFPDMSEAYDKELIRLACGIASRKGIPARVGCYVAVSGPTLETPKEYQYYRIIGGDAVGMSTAPEVIAARQMDIKCFAISVITNSGVGNKADRTYHGEISATAERALPRLTELVKNVIHAVH